MVTVLPWKSEAWFLSDKAWCSQSLIRLAASQYKARTILALGT